MTHEQLHGRLNEWLDGELGAAASEAVSRHVGDCPACESEVLRLRRLGAVLFKAPAAVDPRSTEAFVARVMARVDEESVAPWERFAARFLAPAFGLALAGLVLTISLPRADADVDAPLGADLSLDADAVLGVAP